MEPATTVQRYRVRATGAPRHVHAPLQSEPSGDHRGGRLVAGWLAGQLMRGSGFGLIGDLIVGLLGALIGDWLLPRLGIHLGAGIVALIVNALIGAIVLLLILRLIAGGGWGYRRWGSGRWGRRW